MRDYMKPVVIVNSEVSEGVYAASGSADECYTVNAYIHQRPQLGRGDYRIQVNGRHEAADGHHSGQQVLWTHRSISGISLFPQMSFSMTWMCVYLVIH